MKTIRVRVEEGDGEWLPLNRRPLSGVLLEVPRVRTHGRFPRGPGTRLVSKRGTIWRPCVWRDDVVVESTKRGKNSSSSRVKKGINEGGLPVQRRRSCSVSQTGSENLGGNWIHPPENERLGVPGSGELRWRLRKNVYEFFLYPNLKLTLIESGRYLGSLLPNRYWP